MLFQTMMTDNEIVLTFFLLGKAMATNYQIFFYSH